MAGLIPQHFIDELLARTDIVDIVDAYVPLKKAGKNHHACCPFHEEKTPSFTVSQQKQFYHCFGCGANGTAISFLMEYLHMGFVEAIEDLASRAGMEIPREAAQASQSNNKTTELYELMELVTQFYCKQLRQHPEANKAVDYLKGRGISGEIAKEYELGFAPPGWDNLLKELGRSDDASKRLASIGAVIEKEQGGYYDRFRERITFPIRDQRGRAIGLGGRVLTDEKPKYLNSPETPIFHKGRELYGLYQARKVLKDVDCLFVVEGYMDVIALAQFGISNAVASLGTAATPEHIEKMFRVTNKIVFCFDGDEAGKKAAWRAMENSLALLRDGRQVYFIFLPEGEDPDTYVRSNSKEAFLDDRLKTPLSEFLFSSLSENVDLNTPEGRALMVEKSLPHIFNIPTSAYQDILIQELARLTQYNLDLIKSELSKRTVKDNDNGKITFKKPVYKDQGTDKIKWLVRSLLHAPSFARTLNKTDNLAVFGSTGIVFLTDLIEFIKERPNVTLSNILENWRDTKFEKRLRALASEEEFFNEIKATTEDFLSNIELLIKVNIREFDTFKEKNSPSELTDAEKEFYRNLQKSTQ
jgi:DNA primase